MQRHRRWWPWGTLAFIVVAGLAGKSYFDAQELKTAATQERVTAEQVMQATAREIAATAEEIQQAHDRAAKADVRARELARNTARQMERIQLEMEAAVAEARREGEEQARKQLAPQLEAARAASAPGAIKLSSVPADAQVYINGRLIERPPGMIEGLAPGRYFINVTHPGYISAELTTEVVGSKTTEVGAIVLVRATGALLISSSPDRAEFSIRSAVTAGDAAPLHRGHTPAHLTSLPVGEYVVELRGAGLPVRRERVTIEHNATASVAATFGGRSVVITSTPSGASVLEGGVLLGRTPLALGNVPPRDFTFELQAPGYEPLKIVGSGVGRDPLALKGTLLKLNRVVRVTDVPMPPRLYLATPLDPGLIPRSGPQELTVSAVVRLDGSLEEIDVLNPMERNVEKRLVQQIGKWKFYPGVSAAGYPVKVRMTMTLPVSTGVPADRLASASADQPAPNVPNR
jgi:hypothetical protein